MPSIVVNFTTAIFDFPVTFAYLTGELRLWHIVNFLLLLHLTNNLKLLTYWQCYRITLQTTRWQIFIIRPRMKAYDISKLIAELKSDNVQYKNKTIYSTVAILFWCRRSITTGSSAVHWCIGHRPVSPISWMKKLLKLLKVIGNDTIW